MNCDVTTDMFNTAIINIRKVFIKMEKEDKVYVALYIGAQRNHFSRVPFVNLC